MTIAIDRTSLLVDVTATRTLAEIERALALHDLTLDLDLRLHLALDLGLDPARRARREMSVGAWIADGAPGARDPWRDPTDHLIAGFDARLRDGTELRVRPGPRRAVGPDLLALFFGRNGKLGAITRAFVRVHPVGTPRVDASAFSRGPDPAPTDGERALWDAIDREL